MKKYIYPKLTWKVIIEQLDGSTKELSYLDTHNSKVMRAVKKRQFFKRIISIIPST